MNKRVVKDYLLIAVLGILSAFSFQIFVFENQFAPAGIDGLATMIQYKTGISVGILSLIFNGPLCVAAFFLINKEFAVKSTAYLLVFSGMLLLLKYGVIDVSAFVYKTDNGTSTILAPIAAGTVTGFVFGAVLKMNASTGGVDIIAAFVRKSRPELTLSWLSFIMKVVIAGISYFVYDFNIEPVILCIIYSLISSKIADIMLRGMREQVEVEIVTNDYEAISKEIIEKLRHSATLIPACGMYSGREEGLLICIIHKHQIVKLQEILKKYPDSFAFVSSVSDTMGNFKTIKR